jgi:transcriptional regulator GlxA family with amidase domain
MGAHNFRYTPNEAELNFIRKSYEHCSAFLTVCGGFQAPLMAGVFQGKTATAPREMLEHLRSTTTDIEWVSKRWQRDGKLWTSGILLNGLSLMRAFAEIIWGGEGSLAERVLEFGDWPKRDVNYADSLHTPTSLRISATTT